ncbi:MAG TPA: ROK family protein, partial [Limnochorda sp.]
MRRRSLSSTSFIRSYNAASILRTLYEKGTCTRSQLTRATKISPATVSRIVTQLTEAGIVRAEARAASSGGRRPVLLQIDRTKLHAVGVELRQDQVAMILVNLKGEAVRREAFPPATLEPEVLISELARRIARLIEEAAVPRSSLLGVGLAVAGVVDRERGRVARSVNLGWDHVSVTAPLEAQLDLPVIVENDANAAALSEVWFGRQPVPANLLFLKTEAGVGAGIVLDQQPINGPRGMAGEIGHIPLFQNGHRCRCGQTGCLESYVNVRDVLARYARLAGRPVDQETFFRLALQGEAVASRLVDEAREALTAALSHAALLLD